MLNITSPSPSTNPTATSAADNTSNNYNATGNTSFGQGNISNGIMQLLVQILEQLLGGMDNGDSNANGNGNANAKPGPSTIDLSDAQQGAVSDQLLNASDDSVEYSVIDEDGNGEINAGDTLVGESDGETVVSGELTEGQANHLNGDLGGSLETGGFTNDLAELLLGLDDGSNVRNILDTDGSNTISEGDTVVIGQGEDTPAEYATLNNGDASLLDLVNQLGVGNGNDNGGNGGDNGDNGGDNGDNGGDNGGNGGDNGDNGGKS